MIKSMPNNQKGFIWIIPVIIIVLVGVVAAVFLNKGSVVTVKDAKLEALIPPPPKITEQQTTDSDRSNNESVKFDESSSVSPQPANSQDKEKTIEPFVKIPSDWNTYLDFAKLGGSSRHLITSYQFESFEFPKKGEYALMIGVEDKNISSDLETYLKSKPDISENQILNKAANGTIYIRRDVGSEYFKKVGSTVLVIFVYDNGDQIIDSTEQKAIDSLSI